MTGILIPCYNRPKYLEQCLWSIARLRLSPDTTILLINDGSTDPAAVKLINEFTHNTAHVGIINAPNRGIKGTLQMGYDKLFSDGCREVINFDSDAIVRPDCVSELLRLYVPGTILTGFHSDTCNADGSERHRITRTNKDVFEKQSVGGINLCVDRSAYEAHVRPALNMPGNWDHNACLSAAGAFCVRESLVQHIGFDSSLNHREQPDTAASFYYWDLPSVTLLCADNQPQRVVQPLKKCTEYIRFGQVKLLHPDIRSKEAYSEFILKEAWKHVKTSHALIFQHDGFVNNWRAWDPDFLKYDYIGAPWHYQDGMDVGNGGFSLRSRRLMEACAKVVEVFHPEDHHICRTYRKALESMGFRFAPREVAERFSFEGYLQPDKFLSNQFGVHGSSPRTAPVKANREKYVFNQFLSLGDILFLVPMARALMNEGNEVIWPIEDKYFDIARHFPDIRFVRKSMMPLNYEHRGILNTPYGKLLPYRFASELRGKTLAECMQSKYLLYGHDWRMWRQLYWKRDAEREIELIRLLDLPKEFQLVNPYFGHQREFRAPVKPREGLPVIEMRGIPGFTLIDWLAVAELASEMHLSNSSMNYLLELMDLPCPVYLYRRGIWGEQGFEYTRSLWQNPKFVFVE